MSVRALVGDFDGNGSVGTSDLMQLLTALGSFNTTYDLDGDGVVATADLMVFLATHGQSSTANLFCGSVEAVQHPQRPLRPSRSFLSQPSSRSLACA